MNCPIIKQEQFNTNNGWGFGGGIGIETTYSNGLRCRKGKACYRHTGTSPFERWLIADGDDWYDVGGNVKKAEAIYKIIWRVQKYNEHGNINFYAANSLEEAETMFKKVHPSYSEITETKEFLKLK